MNVENKILGVRAHPHRKLLNLPNELQVGWVQNGSFLPFGSVPNRGAFAAIRAEIITKLGHDVEVIDYETNHD